VVHDRPRSKISWRANVRGAEQSLHREISDGPLEAEERMRDSGRSSEPRLNPIAARGGPPNPRETVTLHR